MTTIDIDLSDCRFHPVIALPKEYDVYDFSKGYDPHRPRSNPYGVGKYNEKRPGMYTTELFQHSVDAPRDIHLGIDIAAPEGTAVHAFFEGEVFMAAINSAAGDYGGTIITQHSLKGKLIWALHGHLSHHSVSATKAGEKFKAGDVIAWVGKKEENGGWNPHLHFQLSWQRPERCDMPGAVNDIGLNHALQVYPDPRLVLGPLY